MFSEMLDILLCPECCKGHLQLQAPAYRDGEIWSGELVCSQCQQKYPVKYGIPCLIAKDLLDMQDSTDAHQWIQKKKEVEQAIIDEDMNFSWATDNVIKYDKTNIFHNAGVFDQKDLFNKSKYNNNHPFDADFSYVDKGRGSIKYVEENPCKP